jgi:hypothetical protein
MLVGPTNLKQITKNLQLLFQALNMNAWLYGRSHLI